MLWVSFFGFQENENQLFWFSGKSIHTHHLSTHTLVKSFTHTQSIHNHYLLTHTLVNLSTHTQSIHTHYLFTYTLVNLFTYKQEAMQ